MMGTNLEARIRERAYQIWEREGRPQGQHLDHWRRAKQEVESQAEQGILRRETGSQEPAPRMAPTSPAAEPTVAEAEAGAEEAKRTVKRKQTRSEAKGPRARRPKAPTSKPKI